MSNGVNHKFLAASATLALSLLAAASASAQPAASAPPQQGGYYAPPVRAHDGFFARVHLGPAYTHISAEDGGTDVAISGTGGAFSLQLGHTISPNLVLFGELFDDIAVDPTIEVNGDEVGTADDVSTGAVGLGIGLAYYFPSNVYVSGTLAMAQLTVQQDGEEQADTDFGPGVSLQVGKEWWVADNWGLGVGLQFFVGTMSEEVNGGELDYTTTATALVVSATYN